MRFHEALRLALQMYSVSRSSAISMIMEKYHAFEGMLGLEDAMRLLFCLRGTGGFDETLPSRAEDLFALSQTPGREEYFRYLGEVTEWLAAHRTITKELACYAADSLSFAFGVTYSEEACRDLDRRLFSLVAADAGIAGSGDETYVSEGMSPHEALRVLVQRHSGMILRSGSDFMLMQLLDGHKVFDRCPEAENAFRLMISEGEGMELYRLLRSGDMAGYQRRAEEAVRALAPACGAKAAGYAAASVSYALGVSSSGDARQDLERRLAGLMSRGVSIRKRAGRSLPGRLIILARTSIAAQIIILTLVISALSAILFPGHATALALSGAGALYSRLCGWQGDASGLLSDIYMRTGEMYSDGRTVERDCGEALSWFRKAAERGSAAAENRIGLMHYYGTCAERDWGEALRRFWSAAAKGFPAAESNLGDMYFFGRGVGQDCAEARKWFGKAAAQGYQPAADSLEAMGLAGECADEESGSRERGEENSAAGKNPAGGRPSRIVFDAGGGGEQTPDGEYERLSHAADLGDAAAQLYLGSLCERGSRWCGSLQRALGLYRRAAAQNNAQAEYRIGEMYLTGRGVRQDYEEALSWYRKAAWHGSAPAERRIRDLTGKGAE